MGKAIDNMMKKSDYEITFHDSPDYFTIINSKMIFETQMVRFICFDENNKYKEEHWYPMVNINRIKRY